MENNTILWILLGLVVISIGITIWAVTSTTEEVVECPKTPDCVCNPAVVEKIEYRDCNDDLDAIEEDMELYEEETGRKIYTLTSSRKCGDFLDNSYLSDNKEVISYANIKKGCKVFYILK